MHGQSRSGDTRGIGTGNNLAPQLDIAFHEPLHVASCFLKALQVIR